MPRETALAVAAARSPSVARPSPSSTRWPPAPGGMRPRPSRDRAGDIGRVARSWQSPACLSPRSCARRRPRIAGGDRDLGGAVERDHRGVLVVAERGAQVGGLLPGPGERVVADRGRAVDQEHDRRVVAVARPPRLGRGQRERHDEREAHRDRANPAGAAGRPAAARIERGEREARDDEQQPQRVLEAHDEPSCAHRERLLEHQQRERDEHREPREPRRVGPPARHR